jgi:hypothetical protein
MPKEFSSKSLSVLNALIISVGLFLGLWMISQASGGGEEITLCVRRNGTVSIVGDEFRRDECRRNETVLILNTQGPAGPPGTSIPCVTVVGNDVYFDGCNVHIRNGSGYTSGSSNGLGNLILGYNEDTISTPNDRTGSHNLIIGPEHTYSSYGGLIAGEQNIISGAYSSVIGGKENKAFGDNSSILGGWQNNTNGLLSSISGGRNSNAVGVYSSIAGGQGHKAGGNSSSISGGLNNETVADFSSVSGGNRNKTTGGSASVSGGEDNEARGGSSSVSGGSFGVAIGTFDWVAGTLFEDE